MCIYQSANKLIEMTDLWMPECDREVKNSHDLRWGKKKVQHKINWLPKASRIRWKRRSYSHSHTAATQTSASTKNLSSRNAVFHSIWLNGAINTTDTKFVCFKFSGALTQCTENLWYQLTKIVNEMRHTRSHQFQAGSGNWCAPANEWNDKSTSKTLTR